MQKKAVTRVGSNKSSSKRHVPETSLSLSVSYVISSIYSSILTVMPHVNKTGRPVSYTHLDVYKRQI